MSDTLAEIVAYKRDVVMQRQASVSLSELEQRTQNVSPPKGFANALRTTITQGKPALIAELKKASPSKGLIREAFEPVSLAQAYKEGGASCLSVLTDERYFSGCDAYLEQVVMASPLPVLRKDFIIDPYQIVESRALGADCILLIMAALSDAQAVELEQAALALGLDVLVESHNAQELERALMHLQTDLIGINNRNLKTLAVDLQTSIDLVSMIPEGTLAICESGIATAADVARMRAHGLHGFLVGESLMRHADVAQATRELLA